MAASNSSISATASSYGYGQAVAVEGVIAPAVAGVRARGTFVLPVGVLSAECADLQEVGFMGRLPSSLKVGAARSSRAPLSWLSHARVHAHHSFTSTASPAAGGADLHTG
jgi:hypothetical protein